MQIKSSNRSSAKLKKKEKKKGQVPLYQSGMVQPMPLYQ